MIFTGAGMEFGHIIQPALFMNMTNFVICCKSYKNIALLEKKMNKMASYNKILNMSAFAHNRKSVYRDLISLIKLLRG